MRVISQDGMTDIQYENFVFGITIDNCIVASRNLAASPQELLCGKMAEYSSKEKALKAVEMLRDRYMSLEIIKVVASGAAEYMEKAMPQEELQSVIEKYWDATVFRLPADDEVQV